MTIVSGKIIACAASVPVRAKSPAKCYVSHASEDSSRAKIGARAKKFRVTRIFTRATHSSSFARERLLRRLEKL